MALCMHVCCRGTEPGVMHTPYAAKPFPFVTGSSQWRDARAMRASAASWADAAYARWTCTARANAGYGPGFS